MQREDYIAGRERTAPLGSSEVLPLPQERDVSQSRGAAPDISTAQPAPRPTVAVPANNVRVGDILDLDDEEDEGRAAQPPGLGPRLIILHDGVQGHSRGEVVWASDLLGYDTFQKVDAEDRDARREARARIKAGIARLIRLGAVREATPVEQSYERVIFVEDMAQAESALASTQAQVGQLADENERLRKQLADAEARLNEGRPTQPGEDEQPPAITPPASTNVAPRPMRAVPVPTPPAGDEGVVTESGAPEPNIPF